MILQTGEKCMYVLVGHKYSGSYNKAMRTWNGTEREEKEESLRLEREREEREREERRRQKAVKVRTLSSIHAAL